MAEARGAAESGRGGRPAPLSLPYLRSVTKRRRRQGRAPVRLGASRARPRRAPVHRPARPLRHHPGGGRSGQPGVQGGRDGALGVGDPRRRQGARPAGDRRQADRQPGSADRRDRGGRQRDRGAVGGQGAADPGVRRARLPGGPAAAVPLPRSAARDAAPQHHAEERDHRLDPPAHAGGRLLRVPDADPDGVQPRGRARLPGAVAAASGQVLRPAAGAAAVQAADHDRGLRPLLPDRALLPRRGRARRPLSRRVLPARPGDELRRAGGRVRGRGARHARPVRGVRACGGGQGKPSR